MHSTDPESCPNHLRFGSSFSRRTPPLPHLPPFPFASQPSSQSEWELSGTAGKSQFELSFLPVVEEVLGLKGQAVNIGRPATLSKAKALGSLQLLLSGIKSSDSILGPSRTHQQRPGTTPMWKTRNSSEAFST